MSKRTFSSESVLEGAHQVKLQHADINEAGNSSRGLYCALPPHDTLSFSSIEDYESHYGKHHTNRCVACGCNFPSQHYLDLHIAESHDPLNSIKKGRHEKTYRCFVEGCDKVTLTASKRRLHLIDKHQFPRNYDFAVVWDGIDGKQSLLVDAHIRQSENPTSPKREKELAEKSIAREDATPPDLLKTTYVSDEVSGYSNVNDLTTKFSALDFAPRQIRFGRRRKGGGLDVR